MSNAQILGVLTIPLRITNLQGDGQPRTGPLSSRLSGAARAFPQTALVLPCDGQVQNDAKHLKLNALRPAGTPQR